METERIEQKAEELIVNAIDFIERSGDYVAEQAPLVVQEFLTYRFYEAMAMCGMFVVAALTPLVCTLVFAKKNKQARLAYDALPDDEKDRDYGRVVKYWGCPRPHQFTFLISLGMFLIMSIVSAVQVIDWGRDALKIATAPRVYLLEELPKLFGN